MTRIKPISGPPYLKTGVAKQKLHRIIDVNHLAFVRTLPCLACGGPGGTAHHLTVDRYRMGRKAGDNLVVPLTERCHNMHPNSLHVVGERAFWNRLGIDPRPAARELYAASGDYERCLQIIRQEQIDGELRRARRETVFDIRNARPNAMCKEDKG